ncbi:MAG TPA: GIY-YIG nuclease family protein [Anaerolineae bacterium]
MTVQLGRPIRSPYHFPAQPGAYALVMLLTQPLELEIGRLGKYTLPSAIYVYAGSARGPGGIQARVERHLRMDKPTHWHIDFLRPYVDVLSVYYSTSSLGLECAWSQALSMLSGASIPVARFGASDCTAGCPAHLIELPLMIHRSPIAAALGYPHAVNIRT